MGKLAASLSLQLKASQSFPLSAMLSLFILTLFMLVMPANAEAGGCCTASSSQDSYCTIFQSRQLALAQNCTNYIADALCEYTDCEDYGCCVDTCTDTQKKSCFGAFQSFVSCSDPSSGCVVSCCIKPGNIPVENLRASECLTLGGTFTSGLRCSEVTGLQKLFGNISGEVKTTKGGVVSNALVTAEPYSAASSSDGTFRFVNIPIGRYYLKAFAQNYQQSGDSVAVVAAGMEARQDILMAYDESSAVHISGVVTSTAGVPIADALVVLGDEFSASTGSDGSYAISAAIPAGQYNLKASKSGYRESSLLLTVAPGGMYSGKNFALLLIGGQSSCGNGRREEKEECDTPDDSACPNQCTEACKCPDTCSEKGYFCADFPYLCSNMNGREMNFPGCPNVANSNEGICCSIRPTEVPECISGEGAGERSIRSTRVEGSGGTMCRCGDLFYDTTSSVSVNQYCCLMGSKRIAKNSKCTPVGSLTGTVSSASFMDSPGVPLSGVQIDLSSLYFTVSNSTVGANYAIGNIAPSSYTLTATKEGYEQYVDTVEIESNRQISYNFEMERKPGVSARLFVSASLVKGKPDVVLIIAVPDISAIKYYRISRDGTGLAIINKPGTTVTFVDSQTTWDTEYTYNVTAYGESGSIIDARQARIMTGNSACEGRSDTSEFCISSACAEAKSKEDCSYLPGEGIVLDYRAKCDANNLLVSAAGGDSHCNSACVEVSRLSDSILSDNTLPGNAKPVGITICSDLNATSSCESLGLGEGIPYSPLTANIFGLYYSGSFLGETCMEKSGQYKYCYYDYFYSNVLNRMQGTYTTVDQCLSCNPEGFCYTYQSEDACLRDNCRYGAAYNTKCKWFSTYPEAGRGICYSDDTGNSNFCGACNKNNPVFYNSGCPQEVCKMLGTCISAPDESNCLGCTDSTTCDSFGTNREACLGFGDGENGYKFTGYPQKAGLVCNSSTEIVKGHDSCKIGLCSFIDGKCMRDSNADGKRDCDALDIACNTDRAVPGSSLLSYPLLTLGQQSLEMSFDGSRRKSYYCLSESGSYCCPDKEITSNVIDPSVDYVFSNMEKQMTLWYYSDSISGNPEKIKSANLTVDNRPPQPDVTYSTQDSPLGMDRTDVFITVKSHEPAFMCEDSLTAAGYSESRLNSATIDKIRAVAYPGLDDGNYIYHVECQDAYGNINSSVYVDIVTDRVKRIINARPNFVTLNYTSVTISFSTLDRRYPCYIRQASQIGMDISSGMSSGVSSDLSGDIGTNLNIDANTALSTDLSMYVDIPVTDVVQDGTGFDYFVRYITLKPGSYRYEISCYEDTAKSKLADRQSISFTIDTFSPNSKAEVMDRDGFAEISQEYYYPAPIFRLSCIDKPQGPPREFGCSAISYCFSSSACYPNQLTGSADSEIIKPTAANAGQYYLCFSSLDSGGNREGVRCEEVKVDQSVPGLSIETPTEDYVVGTSSLVFSGRWNDEEQPRILAKITNDRTKSWHSINNIRVGSTGSGTSDASGAYSGAFEGSDILSDLYEGYNTLEVTAVDPSSNAKSAIVNFYYDTTPPNISSISIYGEYEGETEEIYQDNVTYRSHEYGNPMWISADINDFQYTDRQNQYPYEVNASVAVFKGESGSATVFNSPLKYNSSTKLYSANLAGAYDLDVGNYTAEVLAQDKFDYTESEVVHFKVLDTLSPSFAIRILDLSGNNVSALRYGNYTVEITPSEPISRLSYLSYSVNGNTRYVGLIGHNPGVRPNNTLYGSLSILQSDSLFADLTEADAVFSIYGFDMHSLAGGKITSGDTFTITTAGPLAPVIEAPDTSTGLRFYVSAATMQVQGIAYKKEGVCLASSQVELFRSSATGTVGAVGSSGSNWVRVGVGTTLQDGRFSIPVSLNLGNNFFYARAIDSMSTGKNSVIFNIIRDDIPPRLINITPMDGTVTGSADIPIVAYIDPTLSKISSYSLVINNERVDADVAYDNYEGMGNTGTGTAKISYDMSEFKDGLYNCTLFANDSAGNSLNYAWSFRIDSSLPRSPMMLPSGMIGIATPMVSITFAEPVVLLNATLFSYSNGISSYSNATYRNDITSKLTQSSTPNPNSYLYSYRLTGQESLSDGVYIIEAKARKPYDNTNNASEYGVYSGTFTVDTTAPMIMSVTEPASAPQLPVIVIIETDEPSMCRYGFNDASYDLLPYSSLSANAGRYAMEQKLAVYEMTRLSSRLYIRCRDELGNAMQNSRQAAVSVGSAYYPAPFIILPHDMRVVTQAASLNVIGSTFGDDDIEAWIPGVTVSIGRSATLFTKNTLFEDRQTLASSQRAILARASPAEGYKVSEQGKAIIINDEQGILASGKYAYLPESRKEDYTFYGIASVMRLPALLGMGDNAFKAVLSPALPANATSGAVLYLSDKGVPSGWFSNNVLLEEGFNFIYASAMNAFGEGDRTEVYQAIKDTTKPACYLEYPHAGEVISEGDVVVSLSCDGTWTNITDADMTVDSVQEVVDISHTVDFESRISEGTTSGSVRTYGNGLHAVDVIARDESGNSIEKRWEFRIDDSVPERPQIEPKGKIRSGSPIFKFAFSERVRLDAASVTKASGGLDIDLKEKMQGSMDTVFSSAQSSYVQSLPDGDYIIQVSASRLAGGNSGTWYSQFTIDRTAPVVIKSPRTISAQKSPIGFMFITDEPSVCKYGFSELAYQQMANAVDTGNEYGNDYGNDYKRVHWATVTLPSTKAAVFLRCIDEAGNAMNTSTVVVINSETVPVCGNGVIDRPYEECDGISLGAFTACAAYNPAFKAGSISCDSSCKIDYSKCLECSKDSDCASGMLCLDNSCYYSHCFDGFRNSGETGIDCGGECAACGVCGNGVIERGETCDGNAFGEIKDCVTFDKRFASGTLGCTSSCSFDTSKCVPKPACGDGIVEEPEQCEPGKPLHLACTDFSLGSGSLHCNSECAINTSLCSGICGNGIIENGEQCENTAATPMMNCSDFGNFNPTMAECSHCQYNTSDCSKCGNSILETGEECDGSTNSKTCATFGYNSGNLKCSASCTLDASGCYNSHRCGDGVVQPWAGEECEDGNITKTCGFFSLSGSGISCSDCKYNTTGCMPGCGNGIVEPGEECDYGPLPYNVSTSRKQCQGAYPESQNPLGYYFCTDKCTWDLNDCSLPGKCRDGIKSSDEECEPSLPFGKSCQSFGYAGGVLSCGSSCRFNTSKCTKVGICGNGIVEPQNNEECDMSVGSRQCSDFGSFNSGTLACTSCRYNTSNCKREAICGDGIIEAGEACEQGINKSSSNSLSQISQTCRDLGYASGELKCAGCQYDTSLCKPVCGNGKVEPSEECELGLPITIKPSDFGYDYGTVLCKDCRYDTSNLSHNPLCGNGIIEPGEQCEQGVQLASDGCSSFSDSFISGRLSCSSCRINTSKCVSRSACGNAIIESGEECDTQSAQCSHFDSFISGTATCTPMCRLNTSGCFPHNERCGDGKLQPGEACDYNLPVSIGCASVGMKYGTVLCSGRCQYYYNCTNMPPVNESRCGNGIVEADNGEECDGGAGTRTCSSFPGYSGTGLLCSHCRYDTTLCSRANQSRCGDGIVSPGENCDGSQLVPCSELGYSTANPDSFAHCNYAGTPNECKYNLSECAPGGKGCMEHSYLPCNSVNPAFIFGNATCVNSIWKTDSCFTQGHMNVDLTGMPEAVMSGIINISGRLSNVRKLEVYVNGVLASERYFSSSSEQAFDFAGISLPRSTDAGDGMNTVDIVAFDGQLFRNTTLEYNVMVDRRQNVINFVQPSRRIVNTTTPQIVINTTRRSECNISYGSSLILMGSKESETVHSATLIDSIPEGVNTTFIARCIDLFGMVSNSSILLMPDTIRPVIRNVSLSGRPTINNAVNQGHVTIAGALNATLSVATDSPSRCKYGFGTIEFVEMHELMQEPILGLMPGLYHTMHHSDGLISVGNNLQENLTLGIVCQDEAGLLSEAFLLFISLDPSPRLVVKSLNPQYINQPVPRLSFWTNRQADCIVSYQGTAVQLVSSAGEEGYVHSVSIGDIPNIRRLLSERQYNFVATCSASDNRSETSALDVSLIADLTPPFIKITYPENNALLTAQHIAVQVETEKYANASLYFNDAAYPQSSGYSLTGALALDGYIPSQGRNTIVVTAIDLAGNMNSTSIAVYFEGSPEVPVVMGSFPGAGDTISRLSIIEARVWTSYGIMLSALNTSVYIDGNRLNGTIVFKRGSIDSPIGNLSIIIPPSVSLQFSEGRHTLTIIPVDEFGRSGVKFDSYFVIDRGVPTITLLSPVAVSTANYTHSSNATYNTKSQSFLLSGRIESIYNISDAYYQVNKGRGFESPASLSMAGADFGTVVTLDELAIGARKAYIIKVTARSSMGVSKEVQFNAVYDLEPPRPVNVMLTGPMAGAARNTLQTPYSSSVITANTTQPVLYIGYSEQLQPASVTYSLNDSSGVLNGILSFPTFNSSDTQVVMATNTSLNATRYTLGLSACDLLSNCNAEPYPVNFEVRIPELEIKIVRPRFALFNETKTLVLSTSRPAVCRFGLSLKNYSSLSSRDDNWFDVDGAYEETHIATKFKYFDKTVYFACIDKYGKTAARSVSFSSDSTAPIITAWGDDVYTTIMQTKLYVSSINKGVQCKYANSSLIGFGSMNQFDNYDEDDESKYQTELQEDIFHNELLDKSANTFYVQCISKSGVLSNKAKVTINVDTKKGMNIVFIRPDDFENTSYVRVNVTTIVAAECYYQLENTSSELRQLDQYSNGKSHSSPGQETFTEGEHDIYVNCTDSLTATKSLRKMKSFIVDLTPPRLSKPQVITVNGTVDRINKRTADVLIDCEENLSGIDYYMYMVMRDQGYGLQNVTGWQIIPSSSTDTTLQVVYSFENNSAYIIKFIAVDNSGLSSSEQSSNRVIYSTGSGSGQQSCYDDANRCGGACQKCSLGGKCLANDDCVSGYCNSNHCSQSNCSDFALNGDESDVDCGGACGKCGEGKKCNADTDCAEGLCKGGKCKDAGHCKNNVRDGDESDADCGGNDCDACEAGRACLADTDCLSGDCSQGNFSKVCMKRELDTDADSIADDIDNCVDIANPQQEDLDSDGIGDACDPDADNDGMDDKWELANSLDPKNKDDAGTDLDGDGLSNYEEFKRGTSPTEKDTDGDGYSDYDELMEYKTDPLDPQSHPRKIIQFLLFAVLFVLIGLVSGYYAYYLQDRRNRQDRHDGGGMSDKSGPRVQQLPEQARAKPQPQSEPRPQLQPQTQPQSRLLSKSQPTLSSKQQYSQTAKPYPTYPQSELLQNPAQNRYRQAVRSVLTPKNDARDDDKITALRASIEGNMQNAGQKKPEVDEILNGKASLEQSMDNAYLDKLAGVVGRVSKINRLSGVGENKVGVESLVKAPERNKGKKKGRRDNEEKI